MTQITQIFNFFNPINLSNLWLLIFLPKKQDTFWEVTNLSLSRMYQDLDRPGTFLVIRGGEGFTDLVEPIVMGDDWIGHYST
jgi:hypothetical protein